MMKETMEEEDEGGGGLLLASTGTKRAWSISFLFFYF